MNHKCLSRGGIWGAGVVCLLAAGSVQAAPIITSQTSFKIAVGVPFSYQITSIPLVTNYSASVLPPGLTLNSTTGLLSGTPLYDGFYDILLSATNATGTETGYAHLRLTLTHVVPLNTPLVTNGLPITGKAGAPITPYQIYTRTAATSFSAPNLPAGLSINPATGLITGTPAAEGIRDVNVLATNAYGTSATGIRFIIDPASGPRYPIINMGRNPTAGNIPLTVGFGTAITADAGVASYDWSFGDGTVGTGPDPTHTFTTTGTYATLLTVTDTLGRKNFSMVQTRAMNVQPLRITAASVRGAPGEIVDVEVSYTPSPDIESRSFSFELVIPAGLTYLSAVPGPATTALGRTLMVTNPGNIVSVYGFGMDTFIQGPGVVAILRLQANLGTLPGILPLNFSDAHGFDEDSFPIPGSGVSGTFTVEPAASNTPPTVFAGSNQSITLPNSASLTGSASDDGLLQPLTYQWTQLSGPAPVTFSPDAQRSAPVASFTQAGTYDLQFSAYDGEFSRASTLSIVVSPAGPVINPVIFPGAGSALPGEDVVLLMDLQAGSRDITGTQFTLTLPTGVSFVSAQVSPAAAAAGKSVFSNATPTGANLMIFGMNATPIPAGWILSYTLHVGANAPLG